MLGTVRNFMLTVLRIFAHILFAIVVGIVYYDIGNDGAKVISNIALVMLSLLFIVFTNSMTVVLTYPLEMAVFIREYKSNCYSTAAYFFSKIVADFPMLIIGLTAFQLIANYLTGQSDEPIRMLTLWTMCFLVGWFAQVYGMLGGSLFPIEVSPFIIPVTLVPTVLFCGFFIRYDELPAAFRPLTFISPLRFAFEGIAMSYYGFDRKDLDCSEIFCYYRKPQKILEMLDMEESNYWVDLGGLIGCIFVLHVALFASLRWKVR
ncbi:ATP-binding cassette sub-family G member 1-like [Uranotaenia lowii]|uniref:ATP-binding cassette sub-family G member 1-like n=1 Tax=Uranotaenia lowii TaxID=190385 RepID=UPI00247A880D|nr:ATP-binding cassette sub-family G member 1-like [Uranotaenia lowii]